MGDSLIRMAIETGIALTAVLIVLGVFLVLIWAGFRMGRRTVDQPLPPIIKENQAPIMGEEDPWHRSMTGTDQPGYPTAER